MYDCCRLLPLHEYLAVVQREAQLAHGRIQWTGRLKMLGGMAIYSPLNSPVTLPYCNVIKMLIHKEYWNNLFMTTGMIVFEVRIRSSFKIE